MAVQKLISGKLFKIDEDYLLVGNGAAELINALGHVLHGRMAVPVPVFNEYIRCFRNCTIVDIRTIDDGFQLSKERLTQVAEHTDILAIVTPDNPSGSFLCLPDLVEILDCCKVRGVCCIVDESFIDFSQEDLRYTLLTDEFLARYTNLVVIKSISKSYGVPGLRLGVLATSNHALLRQVREQMPIWNINSFAEYFLQIFPLYVEDYKASCNQIAVQRQKLERRLGEISFIDVYPSQANYIMCHVKAPYSSKEIATQLLVQHSLLIKDLSKKQGFSGKQYIRVAVKDETENERLYWALKSLEP